MSPPAEFDAYAESYDAQHRANIAVTGEEPGFFAEYKVRLFAEWVAGARHIIDFGAGIGNSVPYFRSHLPEARLACADVSQACLDQIARLYPGESDPLRIDGRDIPAAEGRFDAAFTACVLHHIPHEEHVHWLSELRRVVRPGGRLAVFEHNPLNPLTLHAVNTCPFDVNARLLNAWQLRARMRAAGWRDVSIRYHIFFPRFAAALRPLEPKLAFLPLGAQYSAVGVRR